MLSKNTITRRIAQQGQDSLGRWVYALLATQQDSMICVITAYKPCSASISAGPWTVRCQQWLCLCDSGHTSPNPREQFDTNLTQFIQSMINKGHQIILAGDFNSSRETSPLFTQLCNMGLRDAIHNRHFQLPPFRSYSRGNKVIDFVLCSSSLVSFIQRSSYEPFGFSMTSDH